MNQFDDIRPYDEDEIPAAMQRIAAHPLFPALSQYVFPDRDVEEVRRMVAGFRSVDEFQSKVMSTFNDQVIARSITTFTFDGLSRISRQEPYLFISNHRDIMLDSSLLQNVLHKNGFPTTEITFGANLMSSQLIIDIGKSNKMFRVERGGTPKEFYRCSMHLSEYIRHVICDKHSSVWIAQRNGRTKDGNDHTDQGLIKMFGMSGCNDKILALVQLHLLPVSVSYEWEPCDIQKAFEIYVSRHEHYVKHPGEDVESTKFGILDFKGRVHFEICPPIDPCELVGLCHCTQGEYHQQVAHIIDRRIYDHYHLWPNNYIAHDLLYGQTTYSRLYNDAEREAFRERVKMLETKAEECGVTDIEALVEIFLGIYANPVNNKMMH